MRMTGEKEDRGGRVRRRGTEKEELGGWGLGRRRTEKED